MMMMMETMMLMMMMVTMMTKVMTLTGAILDCHNPFTVPHTVSNPHTDMATE